MTFASLLNKTGYLSIMMFSFEHQIRNGCLIRSGFNITSLPYFLWRKERSKETSTPYQTTPYMGCLNQEVAETDDFLTILVSRDTRWVSYATAFGSLLINIISCYRYSLAPEHNRNQTLSQRKLESTSQLSHGR